MDLTVEYVDIRDAAEPQRDGRTIDHFKRYTFFLGKFGPFTERVPLDAPAGEIDRRIAALRATLATLPK